MSAASTCDAPAPALRVWSDYVCPFAYVGFRRLQRALRSTVRSREGGSPGGVAVEWLPFELHPETPPSGIPRDELRTAASAHGADRHPGALRSLLDEDGLELHPAPRQFNSRLALQAAEHARDHGRFDAVHERLFRAAFEEGADLGRPEVLGRLAEEVGLDGERLVDDVLSFRYVDRVVEGLEAAMAHGVTGTPSYRLPDGRVLRGVQPVEVLRDALRGSATR